MPLPKSNERYTYADYLTWGEDVHCELVNGEVYDFASPSNTHQAVLFAIARQIGNYLEGKRCTLMIAPSDVLLFAKQSDVPDDTDTVVQPDLYVVCDKSKLEGGRGCIGAPDMTLEVASPSTARYDMMGKMSLYAKAGVKEYWVVDPVDQCVKVLCLDVRTHQYSVVGDYTKDDTVRVNVLDDCHVDLSKVFVGEPEPPELPQARRPYGKLHDLHYDK